MRTWALQVLLYVSGLATGLRAQQMPPLGRWVNVDAGDFQLLILDFEPDGNVHRLMLAPQFQASYRVERTHLFMRARDGSVDSSVTIRGDTLISRTGALTRVAAPPHDTVNSHGTWRSSYGPMERFITLRSDGQVILEVGFPTQATWRADTLRFASMQASPSFTLPAVWFTLRLAGDTLQVQDSVGSNRRFVRRPWGCIGNAKLDGSAAECH
jgi:hypothetical protein